MRVSSLRFRKWDEKSRQFQNGNGIDAPDARRALEGGISQYSAGPRLCR